MRVLVATDQWFPDRLGGVARVATDTARGWAARGHEVVVLAPEHDGLERETSEGALTVLRVLPRGWLPQTLTDPRATRRLGRAAVGDFDVLVAHAATSASGLLSATLDSPLVYVFHASAGHEARHLRESRQRDREWLAARTFEGRLRRMTLRSLRQASAVAVLSEFSRGVLGELSPADARRAVLVPGGVDTNVFRPEGREHARRALGIDASTRLLFTARRLVPRMGLESLIDATMKLRDVAGLRVVIAGAGSRSEFEAQRDRLGLVGRVDLIGPVPDAELPLWHRAADLFVLPTVAYEGFGLVTIEALASGTPVVGTPIGATPEILEPLEPRLLARGTEPGALAEALRKGLSLASAELRERCREYAVARFSWDAVLPAWERLLESARRSREAGRVATADLRPSTG